MILILLKTGKLIMWFNMKWSYVKVRSQQRRQEKLIVRLLHCTAAETEDCFWLIHSLHFHSLLFFLFGDDVEIMWKLSDGIRLVTSELAVRSCDCVVVTHTVPQRAISHWSDLALFSWLQHIANQQRRMRQMQDEGVEVGTACDTFHTSNL